MDNKAKAYKDTIKKTAKKQSMSMKKPGGMSGPSIKPKDKNGPTARAPMFKKSTRGR